jgi:hypothetical protein
MGTDIAMARKSNFTWRAWGIRPGRHYQLLFLDEGTNVYVHHCGHPTAIYPYYVSRHEDGKGPMILAPNGHGFMSLKDAKEAAFQLYRSERP